MLFPAHEIERRQVWRYGGTDSSFALRTDDRWERELVPEFRKLTEARLAETLRRQDPPAWGKAYDPSIRATTEEAPARSRPNTVWWELMGRYVHVLSLPELWVIEIVLYCPWLWELQEQRMLPYLPALHPLAHHPRAAGMVLPAMTGTLAVANRLGYLRWHPTLRTKRDGVQAGIEDIPVPWIGDFLLFLSDDQGLFCSNLNVRDTRKSFLLPGVRTTPKTNIKRAKLKEMARQETERELYAEAGIATHQIAGDELNEIVVANLGQILTWQKRRAAFSPEEHNEIIEALKVGMQVGKSALEVLHSIAGADHQRFYYAKIVMYQAIWQRRLRIDLFQHFFIDHPLIPETKDILDLYGAWFRRAAK